MRELSIVVLCASYLFIGQVLSAEQEGAVTGGQAGVSAAETVKTAEPAKKSGDAPAEVKQSGAKETAVSEAPATKPQEAAVQKEAVTEPDVKDETAPAPAAKSDVVAPAAQKAKEPQPVSAVAEKKAPPPAAQAKLELAGCVAPVKDMVSVYEKEIVSLNKLMERWNAAVRSSLDRGARLKSEMNSLEKEIADKQGSDDKRIRKEAARLKGQLERLLKEEKILNKDMQKQCREISAELAEFSKGSQAKLKEKLQEIQQGMEGPARE